MIAGAKSLLGALLIALIATCAAAQDSFEPLEDLTVDNIAEQTIRCSGFYGALSGFLAVSISETNDEAVSNQLTPIREQAVKNSDGMLKSAIIVLIELDDFQDDAAVSYALIGQDAARINYGFRFMNAGSSLESVLTDQLLANDVASCGALAEGIEEIIEELVDQ